MNKKIPIIISTISNSFCDFTLDIAVNKYNTYLILLGTAICSFILQLMCGFVMGIEFTSESIIYIAIYGIIMLLGYVFYVLSLKRIPVALTALIESGSLFVFLLIDWLCGYLYINLWFCFLFIMFIFSVFLFSFDTYKFKDFNRTKDIKMSGILILLISMFFYALEPYIIKLASNYGANEIAINIGYYAFSIPFFGIMCVKNKKQEESKAIVRDSKIIKYILLISIFESIYYLFGIFGYINEAAVVNAILQELRVFILFVLSIIIGTDKFTLKKVIAIIIGILSVIGIYLY